MCQGRIHQTVEDGNIKFEAALELASQIRQLSETIQNPEDGLSATETRLASLKDLEQPARKLSEITAIEQWHRNIRTAVTTWSVLGDAALHIPNEPRAETLKPTEYINRSEIVRRAEEIQTIVRAQWESEIDKLLAEEIDSKLAAIIAVKGAVAAELDDGGVHGSPNVTDEIAEVSRRLAQLNHDKDLHDRLMIDLVSTREELLKLLDQVAAERAALSDIRKETCRTVNESMHSFFARIDADGLTENMEILLADLKTGTGMKPATRERLIEALDRGRLIETAITLAYSFDPAHCEESDDLDAQDRVVYNLHKKEALHRVWELACLHPGDRLHLCRKPETPGGDITEFDELTEGLRALAVKEISFAASRQPVITDQPEDAVPSRAIYRSLVPTLRKQRTHRQFLVVSHDANIVVASDLDQITVVSGPASSSTGSLLDARISEAALENLEGGSEAFRRRARFYESYR